MKDFSSKISKIRKSRLRFIALARKNSTPLYLYDAVEVKVNLTRFKQAFAKSGLPVKIFYAIKSNPYPDLLKTIVNEGACLDASSQRELKLALAAKAKQIIYTGPAKTTEAFRLILRHRKKITVNLDSFRELELLAKLAQQRKVVVRCGVRVHTAQQQGWTKFGIALDKLRKFYDQARKHSALKFCGIQFHISLNKNPKKYVATLQELAKYLRTNFSTNELSEFKYVDIGGGFYPAAFEGIHSWNPKQVMDFGNGANAHFKNILADKFKPRYLPIRTDPIEKFAKEIAKAWRDQIRTLLPSARLYAEPGRFISHSAMHFLLKVADLKDGRVAILDGGTNMIGWEKYQFFYYAPIFNLTHFSSTREQPCILYGSLCTPDDLWGYYFYGKKIAIGDILLIPFQGAYTYTLAQNFIKAIPQVVNL